MPSHQKTILCLQRPNKEVFTRILVCVLVVFCLQYNAFSQVKKSKPEVETYVPEVFPPDEAIDTNATAHALIIGISQYKNIPEAEDAAEDAILFRNYLIHDRRNPVKEENVSLILDSNATNEKIMEEYNRLSEQCQPGDEFIFYFAGQIDGEIRYKDAFLLAYNCEKNNYKKSDAVSISDLSAYIGAMTANGVHVMVITDGRRSDDLYGGKNGSIYAMTMLGHSFNKATKLLSCSPNEISYVRTYPDAQHGAFTYYLIQGFQGLADKDSDGKVTVGEFASYIYDNVPPETEDKQHPVIEGPQKRALAYVDTSSKRKLLDMQWKGFGSEGPMWLNDSIIDRQSSKVYADFLKYIKKKQFTQPDKYNAYNRYLCVRDSLKNKPLANYLQHVLMNEVEITAQGVLDKFIKGQTYKYSNTQLLNDFKEASSGLNMELKMLDKNYYKYRYIKSATLFFNAYVLYLSGENDQITTQILSLLYANFLTPKSPYIKHALGLFYDKIKNRHNAVLYQKAAIDLAPDWVYPYNELGNVYYHMHQYDKAANYYELALSKDSGYVYAYYNLAAACCLLQKKKQALIWLEKGLKKDYKYWDYIANEDDFADIKHTYRYKWLLKHYKHRNV